MKVLKIRRWAVIPLCLPHSETVTQPGMNPMESVMAAMQANPNARIQDLIAMAGGINKLYRILSKLKVGYQLIRC